MKNKRFRIEESLGVSHAPVEASPQPNPANDDRISEILATVNELKRLTQTTTGDVIDACRREMAEVYGMRTELDVMKAAIGRTKHEIAVLHRQDFDGKGVRRAAGELDAVVDATERATTTILAAVEEIETHASVLRSTGGLKDSSSVDAILDRTVVLYEACNFQDLTGQRINKVMTTMKFIEHHIVVMMDIWGGVDAIKAHVPPIVDTREGDARLLNGPKAEGDVGHASQDDIDAMFN